MFDKGPINSVYNSSTVHPQLRETNTVVFADFLATTRESTNVFALKVIRFLEGRIQSGYQKGSPIKLTGNDMAHIGYTKERFTNHIEECGKTLLHTSVYAWNELDKGTGKYAWYGSNFFSSVTIADCGTELLLYLTSSLEDQLLSPKNNYLEYPLENIVALPSAKALKLHDILLSLLRKHGNSLMYMDITMLADALDCDSADGLAPNAFIRNNVKRPIEYINKHTALMVYYTTVRIGKKTTAIRFFVSDYRTLANKQTSLQKGGESPLADIEEALNSGLGELRVTLPKAKSE